MIISGQQKIMLNKWQKGLLKDKDLYKFLASRVNKIPYQIIKNGSDKEAIEYYINNSKVVTNPHRQINFFSKLPYSRLENRVRLKAQGII